MGAKRIKEGEGKHTLVGYSYKGYEFYSCGYHSPDKCVWWEAVSIETGGVCYHANTKREIMLLIDSDPL